MDPIADTLSQITNAASAGKTSATVPYSNAVMAIVNVLAERGYVAAGKHLEGSTKTRIQVDLAYDQAGRPKISGTQRISKNSRRVYEKAKNLWSVKEGYGDLVVSTPHGVKTGRAAQEENVGGEVLFAVW